MKNFLTSLLVATFLSKACFSAEQESIESSEKTQGNSLSHLKDYNVDDSFHTNPLYKMVKPVTPLVVEQATPEEIKNYFTQHGVLVCFISQWYITPQKPRLVFWDFNNLETFPSKSELESFFALENSSPFVNCSFASKLDFEDDSISSSVTFITNKRFIECALEKGKNLVYGAGNTNQRSTYHWSSQIGLSDTQKKQILCVGALSPTADNKQKPSLYSAIPGKNDGEFLWAVGKLLIGQINREGTSYAAPRVTGLLSRLISVYPQLTPEAAIEIVCLTASKSPFISTNHSEVDEYLYGRHGAIDPIAALQFAANFLKSRTEGQSPESFFQSQNLKKSCFQFASTLRQKLDLMNFLEQHHADEDSDPEEAKVHVVLKSLAKEINLDDLYAQPQEFFTPDDLYAFKSFSTTLEPQFESFFRKTFSASIRDSLGFTPLHHVADWGRMNLVANYVKEAPQLISDQDNMLGLAPIALAVFSDNINLDIISFLLDHGANPYAKDIIHSVKPFEYVISELTGEKMESSKEQIKKAALIFIQHKTFDPQQFFSEMPMEEWAQEIDLKQKYPDVYGALVKAMTKESNVGDK